MRKSVYLKGIEGLFVLVGSFLLPSLRLNAQTANTRNGTVDSIPSLTLGQCIEFAMHHQPALQKAGIGIDIAKANNAINISSWLPQVNISGNLTHYIQLPTNLVNNTSVNGATTPQNRQTGVPNNLTPTANVTQALFSPQLLYAARTAPYLRKQAELAGDSAKIYMVATVSKSFYRLLQTLEQINVLKEDTARLQKTLSNAYHQYKGGIVDETDSVEAEITYSNSLAMLQQANENIQPLYASLKQAIGFSAEKQFNVSFDTLDMANNIHLDTNQVLRYEKRIEFQQLQTQMQLQQKLVSRYRYGWLPTVSAFYTYNYEFESNTFSQIFQNRFPNSLIGLTFSAPIFTGLNRVKNLQRAKLQQRLLNLDNQDLKAQIYSEYTSALANYKGNFFNMNILQKNIAKAKRVYFIVDLQYKQGIIPYLNVITAESNLISAEIGYINALFQVLSSKIDLEKAMGTIQY